MPPQPGEPRPREVFRYTDPDGVEYERMYSGFESADVCINMRTLGVGPLYLRRLGKNLVQQPATPDVADSIQDATQEQHT